MSRSLFWVSDEAWAAIEPHLPKNQPGARRVDDRRVISGIIHMLMFCRLKDFRRIATRYDKLARNFLSAVSLAAAVAFWL